MRSRIAWGPWVRLYKLHTAHPLSHWVWQGKAWLREAAMAFPYCVCFRRNLGSALASDRTIGEKFKLRHYPVLSPCPVELNDLDGERRFHPAGSLIAQRAVRLPDEPPDVDHFVHTSCALGLPPAWYAVDRNHRRGLRGNSPPPCRSAKRSLLRKCCGASHRPAAGAPRRPASSLPPSRPLSPSRRPGRTGCMRSSTEEDLSGSRRRL